MRAARVLLSIVALAAGLTIAAVPAQARTDAPTVHAASSNNPIGRIESTKTAAGRVTMTGWAFDRNRLGSPEPVHIYQTSPTKKLVAGVGTTIVRADINKAHHIAGRHGWTASFTATPGSDVFCAYAINVGAGTTFTMGCARVTITNTAPTGALEAATARNLVVDLSGWAVDKDAPTTVQPVEVYQTAPALKLLTTARTTVARPDVNKAHHLTGTHGWKAAIISTPGAHTFCAYADNLGPARAHVRIGCRNLTLVAAPGSISGLVTDRSGQPLSDASVTATAESAGGRTTVRSGADGRYTLPALPPGTYEVCADQDTATADAPLGYLTGCHDTGVATVSSGLDTSDIDVQLAVASDVTGIVTDSAGRPLSGVRINGGAAVTGADGRYALRTAGSLTVCFDGPTATGGSSDAGYLPQCWDVVDDEPTPIDVPAGQTVTGIDATLDAAAALSGVVTDTSGHPLSHVKVQVSSELAPQTTGADGSYRFGGLVSGTDYAPTFTPSDATLGGTSVTGYLPGSPGKIDVTAGSVTAVPTFALDPAAAVAGTLTDSFGHPIAGGTIHIHGDTDDDDLDFTVAANGTFTVTGLLPGLDTLCGTSRGYLSRCYATTSTGVESEFRLSGGQVTRGIDVVQTAQGSISGRVTTSAGKPIPDVTVRVEEHLAGGFSDGPVVQTSAGGNYTVPRLDPGTYSVCFYPQNYVGTPNYVASCYKNVPRLASGAGPVTVSAARTTTGVDTVLQLVGAVTGKVTDGTGKAVYFVDVEAFASDGTMAAEVWTDENGAYLMPDAAPGSYEICFDATEVPGPPSGTGWAPQCYPNAEGTTGVRRVTVPAGKTVAGIDAVLQPRAGISGRVTAPDGSPLAGVEVDTSGNQTSATTDDQGYYLLPLTTPGDFAVCFYGLNAHESPSDPGFGNACYDGDSASGTARPVVVSPHRTTMGIDITLDPLPAPAA